ncbi:uncharacterized protein LOC126887053 [Diabrotica virgifera virgifera]|uniref:Myb-like domain-containing protein n=1 Tax=Diabrotica virgifera virgifera TaxID=50390 RepID=A0ABM5KJE5_DIAVI|nr:uncharacterized protein LOC126887053 [Diabrotica virgifera virgifera]
MQKVLKRVTRGKKPEDELDTGDSDRYVHQSTERDQHNENTLSRNYFKKATSPFHESNEENSEEPPTKKTKESSTKSIQRFRAKWSDNEKQVLLQYFEKHIEKKITPRKHECDELLKLHPHVFENKDWVRIKTYVYNTFRERK